MFLSKLKLVTFLKATFALLLCLVSSNAMAENEWCLPEQGPRACIRTVIESTLLAQSYQVQNLVTSQYRWQKLSQKWYAFLSAPVAEPYFFTDDRHYHFSKYKSDNEWAQVETSKIYNEAHGIADDANNLLATNYVAFVTKDGKQTTLTGTATIHLYVSREANGAVRNVKGFLLNHEAKSADGNTLFHTPSPYRTTIYLAPGPSIHDFQIHPELEYYL